MELNEDGKNNQKSNKTLKKDSSAYSYHREKANARKRKFLDNMTEEQKEIKRAKDREYYHKKKAENKVKKISDITESKKRAVRKQWKKASKKYRQKKKMLANAVSDTPSPSNIDLDIPLSFSCNLVQRLCVRKKVKKDQTNKVIEMRRKIEVVKQKTKRK